MKPMMKTILAVWVALLLALVPFALTEEGGTAGEAPAPVEQQEPKSEPAPAKQEEPKSEPATVKQEESKSEPAQDKQEAPKSEPASEEETGADTVPDGKQDQQDDVAPGEGQSGGSVPAGDDAQNGGGAPSDASAQEPAQPADAGDAKAADPSVPADGDEVQSGEDEATEQPAEPVEATEEESDLEEAVEEEPALLAAPALKARALLAAGTGDHPCSYCGQPGLFMALDERVHGYVCQNVGCPHYRDKAYMYDTEAHQKGKISSTSPTFHSYICTICDTVYTDEPHSFGDWQDNGDGTHSRSCICGRTETVEHSYTWSNVDTNTHKGVCECGAEVTEAHHKDRIINANSERHYYECTVCEKGHTEFGSEPHSFGDWKDNGDGTHTGSCICGRTQTVAHTYTWTYVDDDTHKDVCACGAETTEAHYDRWASACGRQPHCEKCDHDYGTIPEHEMWYEDRGESGHKPSCYHCDMYFFLEPHIYGDWKDNGDGTHSRSCICGRTETVAHTYTWTYVDDDTHKGVCVCGAETTEAHYDRWASTCGRQPHCEKCDHDYGSILEHEMWYEDRGESGHRPYCYHCDTFFFPEAHSFTAATCKSGPTCEKCGAVYGEPDPDNHDWSEWMPDPDDANHHCRVCKRKGCDKKQVYPHHDDNRYRDETCHAFVCDVCGGTLFYVESHQFNSWHDNGDDTHSRECDGCRWKETEIHSGGTATCTSGPICEMCGVEYDKPLGHDLKETARVEPTCTSTGTEAYWTCQRNGCGKRFSDAEGKNEITEPVVIKALGHDLTPTAKVEPTCTESGTEAYWTCQRDGCGKRFSNAEGKNEITEPVVIKALGHDLKATARVEPTCTESGTEAWWTCQRDGCGKLFSDAEGKNEITDPVVIKALGHDLKATARVEPTCTSTGTEAYWTCQRDGCGKLFSDAEGENEIEEPVVIHATGHTPGVAIRENVRSATCTASGGYDAVVYCTVCKAELSRKAVATPARGHDYDVSRRTITIIRSRCSRCDDTTWKYNPKSRSLLPGLVRDGDGNPVDYIAGVSKPGDARLLTVTPDQEPLPEAVALWLEPETVEQRLREGIDRVVFRREDVILEIELKEISPDWFSEDVDAAEIDYCVFTLAPEGEGTLVRVEALIGETAIPAARITGVTLQTGDDDAINIEENGVY